MPGPRRPWIPASRESRGRCRLDPASPGRIPAARRGVCRRHPGPSGRRARCRWRLTLTPAVLEEMGSGGRANRADLGLDQVAPPRPPRLRRGHRAGASPGTGRRDTVELSPSGCGRSRRGWLTTGQATASTSTRATTPPTQSGPHLRRWRQINRCAAGRARNWPDRRSVLRAEHRPPPGPFRIRQRGLEPPWRAPTAPDPHPRSQPHPCRRLPTLVTRLRPHRLAGPGRIASHGLSRSPRRP